jgi:hypothetical protein
MEKLIKLKKNHVLWFTVTVILCFELLRKMITGVLDYFELIDRSTNFGYIL